MSRKQPKRTKIGTVTRDDCEWQFFRAGGKGGQAQNKTNSGARCIHRPSGARGESREAREQLQNRRIAFRRMAESKEFKMWVRVQAGLDLTIEAKVEEMMVDSNIKAEVFRDGKWVEVDIKDLG